MTDPGKLYRWLLKIYPARFRDEYETPMERQFRDDYRDAREEGSRLWFWARALWDVAWSAPPEIIRELRQDLRFAMRAYRNRAVSAALAVVALGFAIGSGTAVFTVLNALLLARLPFDEPTELVEVWRSLASMEPPLMPWPGGPHELGVRLALGATRAGLRGMVIGQSLLPVLLGMLAGVVGALASGQYLQHLIVSAEPLSVTSCTVAAALLAATALAAAWLATTTILEVNPLDALRTGY